MMPNFLIIGAQKSASTFVHYCVREHPQAFMPRYETPFFEDPYYLQNGIEQLEALFEPVLNEKAIGIKRPDYLAKPECPARINKHIPHAKLIAVLRNPIDRAVSAYYWYMQTGAIPTKPLEKGLCDILTGHYGNRFPKAHQIIDYGLYYQHLLRYLHYFDREQMLIMLHHEFRKNPLQSIRKVYRFLEIDPDYLPKALNKQPKQSVYSPIRLRWLSVATRYFFYTYMPFGDNKFASYPRKSIIARLIYGLFVAVDRYFLAYILDNKKPELSLDLKSRVSGLYKDDIRSLEDFLDRNLTEWK